MTKEDDTRGRVRDVDRAYRVSCRKLLIGERIADRAGIHGDERIRQQP